MCGPTPIPTANWDLVDVFIGVLPLSLPPPSLALMAVVVEEAAADPAI